MTCFAFKSYTVKGAIDKPGMREPTALIKKYLACLAELAQLGAVYLKSVLSRFSLGYEETRALHL